MVVEMRYRPDILLKNVGSPTGTCIRHLKHGLPAFGRLYGHAQKPVFLTQLT